MKECKYVQQRSYLSTGDPALGPAGPAATRAAPYLHANMSRGKQSEQLVSLTACEGVISFLMKYWRRMEGWGGWFKTATESAAMAAPAECCACLLPALIPFAIHIEGLFIRSRIVGIRMHPRIYLSSHFSFSDRFLGSIMPNLWVRAQFNECNDSSYGGTFVAWSKTSKSVLSSAGRGVNNTAQHSLDLPLNINQGSRFLLRSSELSGCRKQTQEVVFFFF